ncbi:MAG: 2Fe-2S ferredoxin [Rhodobiaceae bacterium]|nr:MAG: 2Fe-2S ferredoxin [Rhodobiaceae bacterium]
MSESFGDARRREKWVARTPPAGTLLCSLDDIAAPGAKGFTFGSGTDLFDMFVVRTHDKVFAYVNACPHAFTPLETFTDRFLTRTKDQILCTTHGALFNLDDGFCTSGPCAGKNLVPLAIEITEGQIRLTAQPPVTR